MAGETDPVRIVVEIVDNFSDELAELRAKLEELDLEEIDVDFEIDEGGEIESIKTQMETIDDERLQNLLDIAVRGFAQAHAKKQTLSRDMYSTLHVNTDTSGFDLGDKEQIRRAIQESTDISLNRAIDETFVGEFQDKHPIWGDEDTDFMGRPRGHFRPGFDVESRLRPEVDMPDPDLDVLESVGRASVDVDMPDRGIARTVGNLSDNFDNLGAKLLKYRPTIMDWWNVLALLIPVLISLAGAVIGLAAAFVSLAAAGAVVLGLGLLGWGDSLSDSMSRLQEEARLLAEELFAVTRPAQTAFQPIVEGMIRGLPAAAAQLTQAFMPLVAFQDEFGQIGAGMVDWIAEGARAAADLNEIIGQILVRFGGAIGSFLIEVLQTMVRDVYRNQNAYMDLGIILLDLVIIIFNVVKAFGFAIAQIRWLFDALALLTGFLSNEFAVALISAVSLLVLLETAVATTVSLLAILSTFSLRAWAWGVFPYITAAIFKMKAFAMSIWQAYGAWGALAMATGGLILGGALLAGGALLSQSVASRMSGPGQRGAGTVQSGGNTFIRIEGDVERRQMDRLLDEVPKATRGELEMQKGMGNI